jgi:hypothetical protein
VCRERRALSSCLSDTGGTFPALEPSYGDMKFRRLIDPYWFVPLEEMPLDMRRMLGIRWREFIHELEDAQREAYDTTNVQSIIFLEVCLKAS